MNTANATDPTDTTTPEMPSSIAIARGGQELGTWSEGDIVKMLAAGVLVPTDHFWCEGMAEWDTLAALVPPPASSPPRPPPPAPAVQRSITQPILAIVDPVQASPVRCYPVVFGGATAVDKLGFVRAGEVRVSAEAIELAGPRHWSAWARAGIFVVATPLLWAVFGALTDALPRGGGAVTAVLGAGLALFTLVGVPLLVLTLMHYFCASPATVRLDRREIHDVMRQDREVTYLATVAPGRPRKGRLRAASAAEAAEIERGLVG